MIPASWIGARVAGLVAVAVLLAPVPAVADYRDDYRKAIGAIDQRKWREAEQLLRRAIAEQPREGERINIYGMRVETYLPQYYLGLALYNLGDHEGALKAWQTSESYGVVQKSSVYATLRRNRDDAQKRLAARIPAPSTPAVTPSPAPAVPASAPNLTAEIQQLEQQIKRAEDTLARLDALPQIARVRQAAPQLGQAESTGRQELTGVRAKLEAGRKGDAAAVADARESAAALVTRLERLYQDVLAERDVLQRADAASAATPAPIASVPPAPTPPPSAVAPIQPELVEAARLHLAARHREALAVLDRVKTADRAAAVQANALRAASLYAVYALGGEKDEKARLRVEQLIRECRRAAGGQFDPDPEAFSPRFRQLVAQVR